LDEFALAFEVPDRPAAKGRPMTALPRICFLIVAAFALAGLVTGTGCTKKGKDFDIVPTPSPTPNNTFFVDPKAGSDTTGNGTQLKPFKTLTKAVSLVNGDGFTINLAQGHYTAANGEKFPIIFAHATAVVGSNYGQGSGAGSFIDGFGEDKTFETLIGAPPLTYFANLEVVPTTGSTSAASFSNIYVGVSKISLPSGAAYESLDVLGSLTATTSSFGAGPRTGLRNINGVFVGGSFSCSNCSLRGGGFAIGALTVPSMSGGGGSSSSGGTSTAPAITLSGQSTQSTIQATVAGIATDGSASLTVANQSFHGGLYAYTDGLQPFVKPVTAGAIDFGQGAANSAGANVLIGASVSELFVTLPGALVAAFADTWNPGPGKPAQGAGTNGHFPREFIFGPGASGLNVTIATAATGAQVEVGPFTIAPTPSPTQSGFYTPSPSPSPSPT
jgi:hypothetical protein